MPSPSSTCTCTCRPGRSRRTGRAQASRSSSPSCRSVRPHVLSLPARALEAGSPANKLLTSRSRLCSRAVRGIPPRAHTAMTGEVTLRGLVTPVGGIKEKVRLSLARSVHAFEQRTDPSLPSLPHGSTARRSLPLTAPALRAPSFPCLTSATSTPTCPPKCVPRSSLSTCARSTRRSRLRSRAGSARSSGTGATRLAGGTCRATCSFFERAFLS